MRALPGEVEEAWDAHSPGEWEALTGHLDDVHELLTRFVAFPSEEAADAVSAWVVHAHLARLDAFDSTPRLAALSPEKGSGKTRTLEVLELVVPQPLHAVNISAAAMFRLVEKSRPTLLLDECDTYLGPRVSKDHEDVRALVNAGHRRGARAVRCVGDAGKMTIREYPAFCAVALAGIGDLPDTIMQRSVVIAMKRRRPDEHVTQYRARVAEPIGHAIRDRLAAWAEQHALQIAETTVTMPEGVTDRAADVWEPLVIIGDAAGPSWSRRLRSACSALTAANVEQSASLGVRLLADVRTVFGSGDKVHTEHLLVALNRLEDAPWGDLRGRELDARRLARFLRPYDVRPGDQRIGDKVAKGYDRGDFHDAWLRYLSPPSGTATSATPATHAAADVAPVADVAHLQHGERVRSAMSAFDAEVTAERPA